MYSVEAIYDGNSFKFERPLSIEGQHKVIITFVETINESDKQDSLYILKPDTSKTPVLGRLQGTVIIPDDFDEPLEEMKEYMY